MTDVRSAGASASAAEPRDVGLTMADVASRVGGALTGDPTRVVRAVAPLDRATASDLSFYASAKYASQLERTSAGLVLVAEALASTPLPVGVGRVVVADPVAALMGLLPLLYVPPVRPSGIDATVRLGRGVQIGADVHLGPYVVVGDGAVLGDRVTIAAHTVVGDGVVVGADAVIGSQVTLHSGTMLGERVVIRSGARLGNEGFKYVFRDGAHQKLPHVGRCLVQDDVEVGCNTCIDRGSIDDTVIGAGTKIDNLVQIAHNVRIGRLCLIISQVGIAGSCRIGDGVVLAGQVGLSDSRTIGDRAVLGAQSGVYSDVPAGETWSGHPARPHREQLRAYGALHKLAGMLKGLEKLLERGS